jgi:hypothetical protein
VAREGAAGKQIRLLRAPKVCYAGRAMVSYRGQCFARRSGGGVTSRKPLRLDNLSPEAYEQLSYERERTFA